jgi:hypothetical protein
MESTTQNSNVFIPKVPSATELAEASAIDQFEHAVAQLPEAVMPLNHLFTPGLYVRQILIPAGTLLTSMTHKTEHPFIIVSGIIDVISPTERICYSAPYMGVTQAGTKRALYAHTDTTWITFHTNPDNIEDPDALAEMLTYPAENPLFNKDDRRCNLWKTTVSPSITRSYKNQYQEKLCLSES